MPLAKGSLGDGGFAGVASVRWTGVALRSETFGKRLRARACLDSIVAARADDQQLCEVDVEGRVDREQVVVVRRASEQGGITSTKPAKTRDLIRTLSGRKSGSAECWPNPGNIQVPLALTS